jgi:ral guanine nucleotide dissociation stimulator-like 1
VDFFNAVSYRVIATVLKQPELATKERARLIEKWIEVAHELRILKNFSSLKAVLSGLTYQAIHRLKQVWKEVDEYVESSG